MNLAEDISSRPLKTVAFRDNVQLKAPHGLQGYADSSKFRFDVFRLGVDITCRMNGQTVFVPWTNISGCEHEPMSPSTAKAKV